MGWVSTGLAEKEVAPARKEGDKKFSYQAILLKGLRNTCPATRTMNQNFTELLVCFITLKIMIEAKRWDD